MTSDFIAELEFALMIKYEGIVEGAVYASRENRSTMKAPLLGEQTLLIVRRECVIPGNCLKENGSMFAIKILSYLIRE